jgi:hypothetical protein
MSRLFCRWLLFVTVLWVVSQSAAARSSVRIQKPVSIMGEASFFGPNGTYAATLSYDAWDWGGFSFGAGYSVFTETTLLSLLFDARILRSGGDNSEHALQLSFGPSFREGYEDWECNTLFGCHDGNERVVTKTSGTLFLSSNIGYAYAHRSGLRLRAYLGWELPIHNQNYVRARYNDEGYGDLVERLSPKKQHRDGHPCAGISMGYAF